MRRSSAGWTWSRAFQSRTRASRRGVPAGGSPPATGAMPARAGAEAAARRPAAARAGSRRRRPVTTTVSGTAEHHRRVVAAEAVRVGERVAQRRRAARARHEVEVARGVGLVEVDGRRQEAVAQRERRSSSASIAPAAPSVWPTARLGRAHREPAARRRRRRVWIAAASMPSLSGVPVPWALT